MVYAGEEGSIANRITCCFRKDNEKCSDDIRAHANRLLGGTQDLIWSTNYYSYIMCDCHTNNPSYILNLLISLLDSSLEKQKGCSILHLVIPVAWSGNLKPRCFECLPFLRCTCFAPLALFFIYLSGFPSTYSFLANFAFLTLSPYLLFIYFVFQFFEFSFCSGRVVPYALTMNKPLCSDRNMGPTIKLLIRFMNFLHHFFTI